MGQPELLTTRDATIRPLQPADLDAVVQLDAHTSGASRRAYFERRRAASLRDPAQHLELAATFDGRLVGFMLARVAGGEYGRPSRVVVLETVGVDPTLQRAGLGRRLYARLDELARSRQAAAIVTQVDWRNHAMLRFLDAAGFSLAKRHVLDRDLSRLPEHEGDAEHPPISCRALRRGDLEAIVRIDAAITGTPRRDYLERKLAEALDESAIAVSLVAESDGFVVGFATARVDAGDYGRVGSVASLDTIGVSPRFAGQGYGHAILAQLIQNLAALRIDRLETEVARDAFDLLAFLYRAGFEPSPKIPFERRLSA
jgi:ribosomal protein S18 acetylase RimI-like enzyme